MPLMHPSQARTATGQSAAFPVHAQGANRLQVVLDVTAISGSGATLTLSVEWSIDGVTWQPFDAANETWLQGDPADALPAVTTTGRRAKLVDIKTGYFRLVWTIAGTSPSVTFSVNAIYRPLVSA